VVKYGLRLFRWTRAAERAVRVNRSGTPSLDGLIPPWADTRATENVEVIGKLESFCLHEE